MALIKCSECGKEISLMLLCGVLLFCICGCGNKEEKFLQEITLNNDNIEKYLSIEYDIENYDEHTIDYYFKASKKSDYEYTDISFDANCKIEANGTSPNVGSHSITINGISFNINSLEQPFEENEQHRAYDTNYTYASNIKCNYHNIKGKVKTYVSKEEYDELQKTTTKEFEVDMFIHNDKIFNDYKTSSNFNVENKLKVLVSGTQQDIDRIKDVAINVDYDKLFDEYGVGEHTKDIDILGYDSQKNIIENLKIEPSKYSITFTISKK